MPNLKLLTFRKSYLTVEKKYIPQNITEWIHQYAIMAVIVRQVGVIRIKKILVVALV